MEQRTAAAAAGDDGENCHVIDIHVVDVSVVLAKAGGDPAAVVLSSSAAAPSPTSSTTVGNLNDAQQDDATADAASNKGGRGRLSSFFRFFHPLILFITIFGGMTVLGATVGNAYVQETKHMALQVLAYAVSIFVANLFPAIIWCGFKCSDD